MAITDWPKAERPREKLLARGPQALSDAELLAIFLRTGVAGKTAVDVARDLLTHFGGLRPLLTADADALRAASPRVIVARRKNAPEIADVLRNYQRVGELRMIGKWFDVYKR